MIWSDPDYHRCDVPLRPAPTYALSNQFPLLSVYHSVHLMQLHKYILSLRARPVVVYIRQQYIRLNINHARNRIHSHDKQLDAMLLTAH